MIDINRRWIIDAACDADLNRDSPIFRELTLVSDLIEMRAALDKHGRQQLIHELRAALDYDSQQRATMRDEHGNVVTSVESTPW